MILSLFHPTLLSPILSDWIDIHDLTKLDSGTCNHGSRTYLLDVISSDSFVHDTTELYTDRFYFEWLSLRSVKVKNVSLEKSSLSKLRPAVLKVLRSMKTIRHLRTHRSFDRMVILKELGHLVQSIDLLPMENEEHDEAFPIILEALPNLTALEISGFLTFNDGFEVNSIENLVPNLTSLNIRDLEDLPEDFLKAMLTNCKILQELRLGNTIISEADVDVIISSCPTLTLFKTMFCTFVDDALVKLVSALPLLKHLSLNGTKDITAEILVKVGEKCKSLETVNLTECKVNDAVIYALVKSCGPKGYKHLKLDMNNKITDNALTVLLSKCPHLESLTISSCPMLTDRTLFAIAKNCSRIKSLNVGHCRLMSDYGILRVMRECKFLKTELRFGGCHVSDTLFVTGAENVHVLHVFYKSSEGNDGVFATTGKNGLSGVKLLSTNVKINPPTFVTMAVVNPNLVELKLVGVATLSSESVSVMIVNCPLLKHVTILGGSDGDGALILTSQVVKFLYKACEGLVTVVLDGLTMLGNQEDLPLQRLLMNHGETLRTFQLFNSIGLTGDILDTIGNKCPHLTSLAFTHVESVLDSQLHFVLESCGELRVLNVSGCTSLTDGILYSLANIDTKLRKLDFSGCDGLSLVKQMEFLCRAPGVTELTCSDGSVIDNNY